MSWRSYKWHPESTRFSSVDELNVFYEKYITDTLCEDVSDLQFHEFLGIAKDLFDNLVNMARGVDIGSVGRRDMASTYPDYCPDSWLLQYRPDYPVEFLTLNKLSVAAQTGVYTQHNLGTLLFKSKPAEDRIRNFRLPEIIQLYPDIETLLGEANDGRYTELELMGMILWLYLAPPPSYVSEFFVPYVRSSENGMVLRAKLKVLSTSIKRWSNYWEMRYKGSIELLIEVETILGYIITSEITDEMLQALDDSLTLRPLRYDRSRLIRDINYALSLLSNNSKDIDEHLNFEQFTDDWPSWTTSGGCSDLKVIIDDVKYSLSKSALPLFVEKGDLWANRHQPTRMVVKAETGKARPVFTAPTYDNMCKAYILKKYGNKLDRAPDMSFVKYDTKGQAQWSAWILDSLSSGSYMASSDIEKNDQIHNSVFDDYCFLSSIRPHLQRLDEPMIVDLLNRTTLNWYFILGDRDGNYKNLKSRADGGLHFTGYGSLRTGDRMTTYKNNNFNAVYNILSKLTIKRRLGLEVGPQNLFGGDDSIQKVLSFAIGALHYLTITAIGATISFIKSNISTQKAEFFRVGYTKSGRFGYANRVIHSVISTNPASLQEIDLISRIGSVKSNIDILVRRSRNVKVGEVLLSIYYKLFELPDTLLGIPVSRGGLGILPDNGLVLTNAVPRYRPTVRKVVPKAWFNSVLLFLNPDELDGVAASYYKDMASGVKDRESVKVDRLAYRTTLALWKKKGFFTNTFGSAAPYPAGKQTLVAFADRLGQTSNMLATSESILVKIQSLIELNTGILSAIPMEVDKTRYRYLSDIINRAKFSKVSEKIKFIFSSNLVKAPKWIVNRLGGSVFLNLLLGPIYGAFEGSFPTDLSWRLDSLQAVGFSLKGGYTVIEALSSFAAGHILHNTSNILPGMMAW